MRRLLILAVVGAALLTEGASLTGCTTTSTSRMDEARALSTAWSSLDIVAKSLDAAATSGALHGPPATTAAIDLEKARAALTAADAAYRAGNDGSATANVATATALITQLVTIASQNGGSK